MSAHRLDRRRFLQLGAGALLGSSLGIARGLAQPGGARPRTLVLVYLQGGADGLGWLPPLRDPSYARLRPRTAVPADRAIALSEDVGMHPGLAPLVPCFARGELLALTGVGCSAAGGSHARADAALHAALRRMAVDWQAIAEETDALPRVAVPSLHARLHAVAAAIRADEPLAAVCLPVPGFDTHAGQARRLEQAFAQLGAELAAFAAALGPRWDDTVVLVISEQGRGLSDNRMGGTDDGEAGAALLLGGRVRGGTAGATWPALEPLAAAGARGVPVQLELADLLASLDRELFDATRAASGAEAVRLLREVRRG